MIIGVRFWVEVLSFVVLESISIVYWDEKFAEEMKKPGKIIQFHSTVISYLKVVSHLELIQCPANEKQI